jgi:hypothetical protein
MEIIVRQYGLLEPVDWDESCEEQLGKQNELWNQLVEIERSHRESYFALTATNQAVAQLQAGIDALLAERDEIKKARSTLRAQARARVPTPELDRRLAEIMTELSELTAKAKAARDEVRARLKSQLTKLEGARKLAVKAARNSSGLWWGNYNAVCQSYERARKAAIKRKGDLRFHNFDGSGRITNQVQGGMTVAELFAGSHSQVQVKPVNPAAWHHSFKGERKRHSRTKLTATVWANGRAERKLVSWPMVMHRPIPEDASIKEVAIHRKRVCGRFKWSVTFTCTREREPVTATARQPIAVNLGWRRTDDGLRVATMLTNGEEPAFVIIPADRLQQWDHCESIRSRRDVAHSEMLARVASWDFAGAPASVQVAIDELRAKLADARKLLGPNREPRINPGWLVRLALAWRQHADWSPDGFATIESWRKVDKRLWNERAELMAKLQGWRRDLYRRVALELISRGSPLLQDVHLAGLSKIEKDDGTESKLHSAARRYRKISAVCELKNCIVKCASMRGVAVYHHGGAATWICHVCDEPVKPPHSDSLRQRCTSCGAIWDQDVNNCRVMLRQFGSSSSALSRRSGPNLQLVQDVGRTI